MPFDKLSLKELKEHAKQHKDLIKGYSKMGKDELVKSLNKHLKRDRSGEVSVKEPKKKVSTMTNEERRQWKMQYGDHSLLDMVKAGHSDPGTPNNPLPAGGRIQKCLDRIDKLKGGQLPSSVRERLEHLEMKLKGGALGSDPKTWSPSGGNVASGKPKKRITLVDGVGPSRALPVPVAGEQKFKSVPTKGEKTAAILFDELEKRIANPNYGKDIPDLQAGQKVQGEEKWGDKEKDKEAEFREKLKKSSEIQDKRMQDIISKYEKQETTKKAAKKAPAKKAPSSKDLKKILDDSAVDSVDFAKKLKAMMPEKSVQPPEESPKKAEKRKAPCVLRGYSKLKKADLVTAVKRALREQGKSVTGLEKETVPALRKLAFQYCGYKPRTKMTQEEVEELAKKATERMNQK